MIIARLSRRFLKISAIIFGSIFILLTAFHFWFIHHAEGLIEDLVESRSNGKLRLEVKKFRFNWFSYDMELRDAVFFSADSNTATTSYRFSVKSIQIRVREILPLVFEKKILIDSIRLLEPDIRVTRLRASMDTSSVEDESVSLPQEMGRVYKSIQDALAVLKVNNFHIDNGRFSLINRIQKDAHPVTITNITFHLENLQVDSSLAVDEHRILFSDNVALQTHNQDITFPDGRHKLSFSNFRINLSKKLVEFDSCTISATKGDSSNSSFTIFFDKLLLTNIDFDTLYQKEVIKADSVYCINPRFRLDVELEKRTGPLKPAPKLNDIIQQLTGDLQLAFVVVQNGSFDINTVRDGKPSSFTSENNNFELQGLRIEKASPNPLTVESFAMAIRNYENFLGDSTYAMRFDSIHLIDNSIFLSNFSLKQMRGSDTINSFNMPQFELRGLSWDDLIFEKKLSAENATLYRPVISYTVPVKNGKSRHDVFQTLAGLGDIIALNRLDISDGQIDIFFNRTSALKLEHANVTVLGRELAVSKQYQSVQRAVRKIHFRKGLLKLNDLTATLDEVYFMGEDGSLSAEKAVIQNRKKGLSVSANGVSVNALVIDDRTGRTEIDGLKWRDAKISIDIAAGGGGGGTAPFLLTNLKGNNTKIDVTAPTFKLSTFQESIFVDSYVPGTKDEMLIDNLRSSGRDFSFNKGPLSLSVSRYDLQDKGVSTMSDIRFSRNSVFDSVNAFLPRVSFITDLNALVQGNIVADDITLSRPIVDIRRMLITERTEDVTLPLIRVGRMKLDQPQISYRSPSPGLSEIEWKARNTQDFLLLTGFKSDSTKGVRADKMEFLVHDLNLVTGGRKFGTGDGRIGIELNDVKLRQEAEVWNWDVKLKDFNVADIFFDSLDNNDSKLRITKARLNDLEIRSSSLTDIPRLVKENAAFRVREITGEYTSRNVMLKWDNVGFDKYTRTFSLDSFSMRPVESRDSFIARQQFQADYITLKTGAIFIGPFDLDTYLTDTIVSVGNIKIDDVLFSTFRDKRKPFRGGKTKPLPVDALRKIPVKLAIDSLMLRNAGVEYIELSDKTSLEGVIKVDKLNATVTGLKNFDFSESDSLRINASASIMDSVKIALQVSESYTDSLSGFLMSATVRPVDGRVLNPVLGPLASVNIKSGYIDTLTMHVVGREYLAFGEVEMFYHDLQIKFLKNGTNEKKGIFTGLINFIANTFIVKNSNRRRTSLIFQERLRERSAINYLVKITLSGIGNSIGIKNNKKLMRKYKKELRKRNLPAVNYDLKTGK